MDLNGDVIIIMLVMRLIMLMKMDYFCFGSIGLLIVEIVVVMLWKMNLMLI